MTEFAPRLFRSDAEIDAIGEGLQMDMKLPSMFQTEQQIRRALQQAGQQPRPLWERGRLAKKVGRGDARALQRHSITGDGQPFALIQPLG